MAQTSRKVADSTGRRRGRRRIQPYAWLGAGAMTLGLGAAMAGGTAIAHADDASNSGASGVGHSRSADTGSASSPRSAQAAKRPATASAAVSLTGKRTPSLPSASGNGSGNVAPAATAVSASQSVASAVADAVATVQTDLTPKSTGHSARTIAVTVPTAAVSTASSAGSTSQQSAVADPAASLPPAGYGPWAPPKPAVPPYLHVQQAYTNIATAQSALNAATWGSGNIIGGLAAIAPQIMLSVASFELSAWEGSNPGAQGFFANTAGIPIIHQIAQVTLAGTMLLPAMSQFSLNVANFLLPVVGLFGSPIAPAQAALSDAQKNGQVYAVVPVRMYNTTEPLVNVAVNGGSSVPVLVDSGSSGLVISQNNVGDLTNAHYAGSGTGAYSGGLNYDYNTYDNVTVDFGNGVVSQPTSVNVVTKAWYPADPSKGDSPSNFDNFLAGTGGVGIMGIGANAYGPGPGIPTTSLPGELSDGVLMYQNFLPFGLGGFMVFGPNALPARATLTGTPITPLQVSINGGTKKDVMALVDTGGVYGTMPSDIVTPVVTPDGSYVPAGTNIAVYAPDGTLLYTFTTGSEPYAPSSVGSSTTDYMNTGYYAYQQGPVYIDYSGNGGSGYTVFDYS